MDSPLLTVTEVAAQLGISDTTCRQWLKSGFIPCTRDRSRYLIHRAEFERWCAEGKAQQPQPVQAPAAPTSQTVSINANGLTLEISISIKADEGRQLRPVVSIR